MSDQSERKFIIEKLISITGKSHTIINSTKMLPYTQGYRFGYGPAIAVTRPASILQMWKILKLGHKFNLAIIIQAANTGLTGGSTPNGEDYDRPILIINTARIDDIHLINDGKQIIALPGSTLFKLEDMLKPYKREPHSLIGSSCIGASIVGGICNNSGGALLQRGPAYTELSLFAQINSKNELLLVNNLGIYLGNNPEEILVNLQHRNYKNKDIQYSKKNASDNEYFKRVREVDAKTPSRFNNDSRRLYESSGCAGKLAVFAVRLDTFKAPERNKTFFIGTNHNENLETIRREILLNFKNLPVSGEYLDQSCYDISKIYGKDLFFFISKLGSKFIPVLFSLKISIDRLAFKMKFLPKNFSDIILQFMSSFMPNHLPKSFEDYRKKYKHYLVLEMSDDGIEEAKEYLKNYFNINDGDFFECSINEAKAIQIHRFVVGAAIGRYKIIHKKRVGSLATFDIALRRNDETWLEQLPYELTKLIHKKFYYGHFFCHVFHQNYILNQGIDVEGFKKIMLNNFDSRGAEYPAEHNVGHEYIAKDALKEFYKNIDPTNSFNPGIGKTSKLKYWN